MQHNDAAKDWGALGAWALFLNAITYKPNINSSRVQGESTREGMRQEGGAANGGTETVGEAQ